METRLSNERLKLVLSEATAKVVSVDPAHGGVCCDLDGAKERGIGVRSYLQPAPEVSHIALAAWPADTLAGGRKFYANRKLVQAFRDQGRIERWQLKPSFRFGYWDGTQIVKMSGAIDVDSYIAMSTNAVLSRSECMKRPGRLSRAEWDPYLRELIELGIATDEDVDRFHDHFSGFQFADARPGLELSRTWAIAEAEALDRSGDLVLAVRGAFGILAALCQA